MGLKTIDTFEELNLNPDLLRGIYAFGFEKPSIIQQKGILPVISKRDTIAQAQSGTGKAPHDRGNRFLVLSVFPRFPTHVNEPRSAHT